MNRKHRCRFSAATADRFSDLERRVKNAKTRPNAGLAPFYLYARPKRFTMGNIVSREGLHRWTG